MIADNNRVERGTMDANGGDGLELRTTMGQLTGDIQKDMKMLMNFVFNQTEEMRYLMDNLDVTNFNDLGLARYENGRMQIYTKELNLKAQELTAEFKKADETMKTTLEVSIGGLRTEVEEDVEGLGQWIAEVELTAQGLQSRVSDAEGNISTLQQTATGLQTTVSSHTTSLKTLNNTTIPGLRSDITQNANSISLVVSNGTTINAASIVTAINNAGSSVKIKADHVEISGFVTVSDLAGTGKVEINAGNIKAGGTISGVALESVGSSTWKTVTINNGVVDFYSGWIRDQDLGILQVYGNSQLYLESDGNVYMFVGGRGKCWRFGSDGIYFCDNSYMEPTAYVPTQKL